MTEKRKVARVRNDCLRFARPCPTSTRCERRRKIDEVLRGTFANLKLLQGSFAETPSRQLTRAIPKPHLFWSSSFCTICSGQAVAVSLFIQSQAIITQGSNTPSVSGFKKMQGRYLEDVRNHSVRDRLAVCLPVGSILGRTALVVPVAAVRQQQSKENDVKPDQWMVKARWQRPKHR